MSMTMTQKILAKHAGLESVVAGQLIEAKLDMVLGNDVTSPVAINEMTKFGKNSVFDKTKISLVMDHFTPNKDIQSAQNCKQVREFAKKYDITHYYDVGNMGIEHALLPEQEVIDEITSRFDKDKLMLEVDMKAAFMDAEALDKYYDMGVGSAMLKHIDCTKSFTDAINNTKMDIMIRDGLIRNDLAELLSFEKTDAVSTNYFEDTEDRDIYKAKRSLKDKCINVEVFESLIDFSDFKLMDNGLIPVVVQDYRTNEVLMVAYMNEESYAKTIECGKMTYYSRSRQELWLKGDTSGHYQYVKKLMLDCDNDTILAKVRQVGAACHTGSRTCFFKELAKKEYIETNPLTVLLEDYKIIMDRKENPKEGSYTNYLFDKGIDKILKKCGEEATEIVIAAKNPDSEELKYEIADFLYHMMVLMAECDIDWSDITKELVNRR